MTTYLSQGYIYYLLDQTQSQKFWVSHLYSLFPDMKKEPYESINLDERVPAIEDPDTGIML